MSYDVNTKQNGRKNDSSDSNLELFDTTFRIDQMSSTFVHSKSILDPVKEKLKKN